MEETTTTTDTRFAMLQEAIRTAARMVLDSDLIDTVNPSTRECLEATATADEVYRVSAEFRLMKDGMPTESETYCTLYVEYRGESYDVDTHEDGSVWRKYVTEVNVNWSSLGTVSPKSARRQLEFYTRVTSLADGIAAAIISGDDVCIRTVEEQAKLEEERTARLAQNKLDGTLNTAADTVRKGMRVGQERRVPSALLSDVPIGTHDITRYDYNGTVSRKFQLYVYEDKNTAALLTRIS